MLDPAQLFTLTTAGHEFARPENRREPGPVLVQALDGFVDAGSATRLARAHLLAAYDSQIVAEFDVDQLFDYRDRRPEMIFATDHWESYATPSLAVHLLRDADEIPFLVLAGPEPDLQWERFVAAIRLLMERFGARMSVGLNSIPMGVPHTRPTTVIAHASRPDLIEHYSNWLGTVQVPASAGHLLEFRLAEAGLDSMGFAANVPHYLANVDYPQAASKLIECVADVSGLRLPTASLKAAADATRAQIDAQVADSDQVAGVVAALEQQYDEAIAGSGAALVAEGGRLPTADEIGAEFEQYLAERPDAD